MIGWIDGEFEIDFGATSDRETTTLSTTGLLMEAMRLMDEANQSVQEARFSVAQASVCGVWFVLQLNRPCKSRIPQAEALCHLNSSHARRHSHHQRFRIARHPQGRVRPEPAGAMRELGWDVVVRSCVAGRARRIRDRLVSLPTAERTDLILTTGGTGIGRGIPLPKPPRKPARNFCPESPN